MIFLFSEGGADEWDRTTDPSFTKYKVVVVKMADKKGYWLFGADMRKVTLIFTLRSIAL